MPNRKDMRHSTDRRVVRTRTAIEQAFIELLETTDYDKITISAIAQTAQINRKTFYLHYASVDELLDQAVENLANRVIDSVSSSFDWEDSQAALPALSRAIMVRLSKHADLEANLFSSIELSKVLSMARKPLTQRIERAREERGLDPIPHLQFYVACYLGALFGAYDAWQEGGRKESLDDVAEMLHTGLAGCMSNILADSDTTLR